jgi:hypothetical protein
MQELPLYLFLSVGVVTLFSFVAVVVWTAARQKEREAYYKSETLKKITEMQSTGGSNAALEFLREEDKNNARRAREGAKVGGLVTVAVGTAMLIFLRALVREEPVFLAGLIPLFIGVAQLAYAYFLARE